MGCVRRPIAVAGACLLAACGRLGYAAIAVETVDADAAGDADRFDAVDARDSHEDAGLDADESEPDVGDSDGGDSDAADSGAAMCVAEDSCAVVGTCDSLGVCNGAPTSFFYAADGQSDDGFGLAIERSGSRVVIGAPGGDSGGQNTGVAYVYDVVGGSLSFVAKLTPSVVETRYFGCAVATDGDRIAVGAYTNATTRMGSVFVFDRQGDGSYIETRIDDTVANGTFGLAVALEGDRLVIGATDTSLETGAYGAAYVYERQGDGTWVRDATFSEVGGDDFGYAVSLRGDHVAVGSLWDTVRDREMGAVRVYERIASGWSLAAMLNSEASDDSDATGDRVRIDDSRVVSGAIYHSELDGSGGALLVWDRVGAGFSFAQKLVDLEPGGDDFGAGLWLEPERILATGYGPVSVDLRVSIFRRREGAFVQTGRVTIAGAARSAFNSFFGGGLIDPPVVVAGDLALVGLHAATNAGGARTGAAALVDVTGL